MAGDLRIGGRTCAVRLPSTAPDDRPVPLVLALHGNHPDASGRTMREWTTFDTQADAYGFAIAYPDGQGGCWADGRGVTTADEAGVDDVGFLRGVIDRCAERYGTAPDRAVVAGVSNGAFMAHRLALEASSQVAVLAAVAGGMPEALSDRQPTHAVSAMLIHGTADTLSPIAGGYSRHRGPNGELRGRTLSLDETSRRWCAIDRCPAGTGRTEASGSSRCTTVDGGVGGTRVVAWTLYGLGHAWPARRPTRHRTTQHCTARHRTTRRRTGSTRPRRSAGSPDPCSSPPTPGGSDPAGEQANKPRDGTCEYYML